MPKKRRAVKNAKLNHLGDDSTTNGSSNRNYMGLGSDRGRGGVPRGRGNDSGRGRGGRKTFNMRDEAQYTSMHYDRGYEDAPVLRKSRATIAFVKSSTLLGSDGVPQPKCSTDTVPVEISSDSVPVETPLDINTDSEDSVKSLYSEILDEEDRLVEHTKQLPALPNNGAAKDTAIDIGSDPEQLSEGEIPTDDKTGSDPEQLSEGEIATDDKSVIESAATDKEEEARISMLPDDMLFMTDDARADINLTAMDEVVFAPRRIHLSSSGVRFDSRPLEHSVSEKSMPRIVDETVYAMPSKPEKPETVTTSTKPKKPKNSRTRSARPSSIVNLVNTNPLDDYIRNLYGAGVLDDSSDEVESLPAPSDTEDAVNIKIEEDSAENESGEALAGDEMDEVVSVVSDAVEVIQIQDDSSEENGSDEDVDEGDFDYEDLEDDDDVLDAERRFAAATFMDVQVGRKMKKKMPDFEVSDDELEYQLRLQWLKDKNAKKERKKERERLRHEGLLGKKAKAGKVDLNAKYSRGMHIKDVKREIERFFSTPGETTLSLPPMDKASRKSVHILGAAYGLSSKSIGGGKSRFTILYKKTTTENFRSGTGDFVGDRAFFPRLDKKSRGSSQKDFSNGGTGKFAHREGDVVGNNAPEIDSENVGRRLLEKMGWVAGSGLGTVGNTGIATPIMAKVKTSKAGLG